MSDREEDIILVNPGGRVVEVPNDLVQELIGNPEWSKPTADQVKEFEAQRKANSPAVLAKREEKHKEEEAKAADDYFKGANGEPTGAQPAAQSAQDQTAAEPTGSAEADNTAPANDKPKSRKSK